MEIDDRLYGKVIITEPVLLELLEAPSVLRLKDVSQLGVPDKYWFVKGFSRYEHSIGVMLLLRRLGASLEEQVAGLLHDVSHAAFSHVIDWVVRDGHGGEEDFQDSKHLEYIQRSKLPAILTKYGYDVDRIAGCGEYFSLLEKETPNLCADRVDYALHEFSEDVVFQTLSHLVVVDGGIVFDNVGAAYIFAKNFLHSQMKHWGGFEGISRFYLFSELLKHAIAKNIISFDDLWGSESEALGVLEKNSDVYMRRIFDVLLLPSLVHLPVSKEPVHKKFRHVDPLVMVEGGKLERLSAINKVFKEELQAARAKNEKGVRHAIL